MLPANVERADCRRIVSVNHGSVEQAITRNSKELGITKTEIKRWGIGRKGLEEPWIFFNDCNEKP